MNMLVEKVPPHETAVNDALSDKEVERKSTTIVEELSSTEDYKVWMHVGGVVFVCSRQVWIRNLSVHMCMPTSNVKVSEV